MMVADSTKDMDIVDFTFSFSFDSFFMVGGEYFSSDELI